MDQPTSTQPDLDEFLGVEPPSQRSRYIRWGIIAVGVLILLWIASRFIGGGNEINYATREVERGDLTVTVSATGNLQPTNEVEVGSELSGLVTQVNVDNNDRVTKGQVLARLDTSRLQDSINQSQAGLQSAQASVAQARATAEQSRANLARFQEVYRLSGGKVPAGTEMDTARADYARAQAGVRTAEASVAQARAQLSSDQTQFSKASILSPVNGVVLSRQVEPGQTVAASLNAPVLFVIAEDLSNMRLEVKVDEADVGQVAAGQDATFQVDAFPGRTFPARIERVDVGANASSTTGTSSSSSSSSSSASGSVVAYTARLTVGNGELLLRPGMTATANIVTAEKDNVLLVPNAALRFSPDQAKKAGQSGQRGGLASVMAPQTPRRGGNRGDRSATIGRGSQQRVYILDADGKPEAVRVTVGDSNGSMTEIVSGDLKEGAKVITGQLAAGQTDTQSDRSDRQGQGEGGKHRKRDRDAAGGSTAAVPAISNSAAAVSTAPPVKSITQSGTSGGKVETAPTTPSAPSAPAAGNEGGGGRWANMSDAERAERRARFQNMTEEERAAFRERRRKEREAGGDGE